MIGGQTITGWQDAGYDRQDAGVPGFTGSLPDII
jgi:hypothetical protein